MEPLRNMPDVKMGLVAVSRDCFPVDLARRRLAAVVAACRGRGMEVFPAETIIETEADALEARAEMEAKAVNAVAIYLGNFGPEGPTTIFARNLGKPFMLCAAAEETKADLRDGRGDAFCGLLNASYNCGLRNLRPFIPDRPVGLPDAVALMIDRFTLVARAVLGLRDLKVLAFGPRPQDFYACNAPIKPLYDLGIEVMENSELDLYEQYRSVADRKKEIAAIADDMAAELGDGNAHPEKLPQLAQFELCLTEFMQHNLGSRRFAVFANKCWPSFEPVFGFVPCYVNSRLASRGISVACEVDMYGAVSEYLIQLVSQSPATLLDINNTVPEDLAIGNLRGAGRNDLFMGFHCGNTPSCMLCSGCAMKYQLIMHRLLEPDKPPNITCGTLEGRLKPGPVTLFRLQGAADGALRSYAAQGHVLDADPASFGSIGIIGIPEFSRFYRHVLLEKQFPHHTAMGSGHAGRVLFDAVRMLGVEEFFTPKAEGCAYPGENPFPA